MENQSERPKFECYYCGVILKIDETIYRTRQWGNYFPIISCNGPSCCRSDEADEDFVNQRIEEEYRRIVKKQKDCEEFTKQKQAHHARYGSNSPFFIIGDSDPCL